MSTEFSKELVVVKFGSDLVTDTRGVDLSNIQQYVAGLAQQHEKQDFIVVTSGAIAAGKARLRELGRDPGEFDLPVLSELGSSSIMHAWETAFAAKEIAAGSVLVTHHEISEGLEGGALRNTLTNSLESGVVSIVNENDSLSSVEIMKLLTGGDNDGLASHLAHLMGAKGLRLFTAGGGLHNKYNQLVPIINGSNIESIRVMLQDRCVPVRPGNGRGGMLSKVEAAYQFVVGDGVDGRWAEIAKPSVDMLGKVVTRVLR